MRLSRKKAIELCIELWEWCAKTGRRKSQWPGWNIYGHCIESHCWFCEYASRIESRYKSIHGGCHYCPLVRKLDLECFKTFYHQYEKAKTLSTSKKYAKLFLEQIKKCK